MSSAPRRGPRPRGEDTRAAIVAAARQVFAAQGYDRASLRGIARAAEVDARLVHHYFEGGKAELFAEVMAVPVNPVALIAEVVAGPPGDIGTELVRTFLSVWDDPTRQGALVALVRSAVANESLAGQLRGYVERGLVGQVVSAHPVIKGLPPKERRLRAGVIASQMLGLVMARYVVRLPDIADAPSPALVVRFGSIIQAQLEA